MSAQWRITENRTTAAGSLPKIQMNYKFGRKNQWRRSTWNAIVERLSVPPREAVVLYLAGEQNLDKEVMLRKGFREENIIAIDMSRRVVRRLRDQGTLAICGKLQDVIKVWENQKVDVLYADLCCGFEKFVAEIIVTLPYRKSFGRCACMFNLLRGRDNYSNNIRGAFAEHMPEDTKKHRGAHAYSLYEHFAWELHFRKRIGEAVFAADDEVRAWQRSLQPAIDTYMSDSGQVFDSVVFVNHTVENVIEDRMLKIRKDWDGLLAAHPERTNQINGIDACVDVARRIDSKMDLADPLARQTLAVRATRTRKLAA